jgi:hypothetical protein
LVFNANLRLNEVSPHIHALIPLLDQRNRLNYLEVFVRNNRYEEFRESDFARVKPQSVLAEIPSSEEKLEPSSSRSHGQSWLRL